MERVPGELEYFIIRDLLSARFVTHLLHVTSTSQYDFFRLAYQIFVRASAFVDSEGFIEIYLRVNRPEFNKADVVSQHCEFG